MTQRRFDILTKVNGGQEASRDLDKIGQSGKRSFDQIRQASGGASGGLQAVNKVSGDLDNSMRGLAGRLGTVGGAMSKLGATGVAAAAGIGATVVVLQKAVDAASQFEQSSFQINQLLATTGNASGKTADQIETLAKSLGESTLASTGDVRKAAAQLLTFKNVAGDAFDRTLVAAQDLASIGMGSISSASLQLAKALEDPERGLAALRDVGVSFSASQTELIKGLVESGKQFEAQSEILATIEAQVGGAGTAQAGGLAGAVDTLGERWGFLLENIGNAGPIQAATAAMAGLATVVGDSNDALFQSIEAQRGGLILQISDLEKRPDGASAADDPRSRRAQKQLQENLQNLRAELALIDRKNAAMEVTAGLAADAADDAAAQAEADRKAGIAAEERVKAEEKARKAAEKEAEAQRKAAEKLAKDGAERVKALEIETEQLKALYDARLLGVEAYEAEQASQERSNEIREKWNGLSEAEQQNIRDTLALRDQEKQRLDDLIEAEKERAKAAEEAAKESQRAAEEAARAAQEPFLNAAKGIQTAFADTFTSIFRDGIDSFGDLADAVKDIFFRMAGELAAVNLFGGTFANIGSGNLTGGNAGGGAASGSGGLIDAASGLVQNIGSSIANSFIGDLSTTLLSTTAPSLFGSTAVGLGAAGTASAATAASVGVAAVPGGLSAAGIASAAPLAAAAPFVLPVLAAVAVPLIAGLLKKKPSNKEGNAILELDDFGISVGGQEGKKFSQENRDAAEGIAQSLAQYAAAFEAISGGDLTGSLRVGIGNRDGIYAEFGQGETNPEFGYGNDTRKFYDRSEAGIAALINDTALLMADEVRDKFPEAVQTALDNIDFTAETALSDLNFAANFTDLFGLDAETVGPIRQAYDALQASIEAASDTAERLGLSLDEVAAQGERANQAFTDQIRGGYNQRILELLDPNRAELIALRDAFDAERADLIDAGQSTVGLDVLQQLAEQRVLADQIADAEAQRVISLEAQLVTINDQITAADTLASTARGLIASVDQIQTGRLLGAGSPLSPSEQFSLAQGNLNSIAARIRGGELVDASELSAAVAAFDAINLEIFGLSDAGVSGFDQVSGILDQTKALASTELSRAESQLSELQKQTVTLELIRDQLAQGAANSNGFVVPDGFNLGLDANAATNAALLAAIPRLASLMPNGFNNDGMFQSIKDQLTPDEMAKVIGITGGFATGGSITLGGSGVVGTDRQRVAVFNASPGERVTVETGAQQSEARMTAAAVSKQTDALRSISNLPQVVAMGAAETNQLLAMVANTLSRIEQKLGIA